MVRAGVAALAHVTVGFMLATVAPAGEPGDVTGDGEVDGADLACVVALAYDLGDGCAVAVTR